MSSPIKLDLLQLQSFMLTLDCSGRVPLSVPRPMAASATFCVYGSSRRIRSLSRQLVSIYIFEKSAPLIIVAQTSFCGFSPWYAQPSCSRFQTILRIRCSNAFPGPGGPLCPWWLCTGEDALESRDRVVFGRSLW